MERGKPVPLNPNHTHFILVDDGRKNRSGRADLALRSRFEKAVLEGIDWFIVIANCQTSGVFAKHVCTRKQLLIRVHKHLVMSELIFDITTLSEPRDGLTKCLVLQKGAKLNLKFAINIMKLIDIY